MKAKPLVSVVIPCFNAEKFLAETLQSVARQTLIDYEVITINDGSTDRTASILAHPPIPLTVLSGPNQGASHARRWGTQVARGSYIQYLDCDDLLAPHAIETRLKALELSNADVAYSDWQKYQEQADGRFELGSIIARKIEEVHADPEIAAFTHFWAPPAALMYRRTLVDRLDWSRTLPRIQDARYLLDAASLGARFVHVPGVGAYYRLQLGSDSLSRSNPEGFLRDILTNAREVHARWIGQEKLNPERARAVADVYAYVVYEFFLLGNDILCKEIWRELESVQPGFRLSKAKLSQLLSTVLGARTARPFIRALLGINRLLRREGG